MPQPIPYPPRGPSVAGDVISINRFLNSPRLVERRLRTISEQRFISDRILTGSGSPEGGAIQYEESESIYSSGAVESIQPTGEFPLTGAAAGPTQVKEVEKWGQDALVAWEAVKRLRRNPVDRALTKISNSIVKKVDSNALAAIEAAPIQTSAASDWTAASADTVITHVGTGIKLIVELNEGFVADTLLIDDTRYLDIISKDSLRRALEGDSSGRIATTGSVGDLVGLRVMVTPNLPAAGNAYVIDTNVAGGQADERPLYGTSWWIQEIESWRLRGGRITVPYVNEPKAIVKLTGV